MPKNMFGHCRAEMAPQSGFGCSLPCPRSSLAVTCPLLEFLIPPPTSVSPRICLRHTPHCLAVLGPQGAYTALLHPASAWGILTSAWGILTQFLVSGGVTLESEQGMRCLPELSTQPYLPVLAIGTLGESFNPSLPLLSADKDTCLTVL